MITAKGDEGRGEQLDHALGGRRGGDLLVEHGVEAAPVHSCTRVRRAPSAAPSSCNSRVPSAERA
jgi:hypothetical protein